MNAHKIALHYLKEQVASVEKFRIQLEAERRTMGADIWSIDFMLQSAEKRKAELLEALSEATFIIHSNDDPKTLIPKKDLS